VVVVVVDFVDLVVQAVLVERCRARGLLKITVPVAQLVERPVLFPGGRAADGRFAFVQRATIEVFDAVQAVKLISYWAPVSTIQSKYVATLDVNGLDI